LKRPIVVATALGCTAWFVSACAGGGPLAQPAWKLPPPPAPEAPVVRPGTLHRAKLDNGLEVIVLEDRRLPRVAMGLSFRRGEGDLPASDAGLASFMAELLERGAGDRDALSFAEYVDEIGASFGAASGWDSTSVSVTGLSRDLDRLFEILVDGTLRPRFDAGEAEIARGQRLAAIARAKDDPASLAAMHTARALYAGHRYGIPISGDEETVSRFDAEAARALHERLLVPNDAIFFASGDVDARELISRVAGAFGDWRSAAVLAPGPAPPAFTPTERRVVIVDRPDLPQARITVAHEGLSRTDDDRIAAGLLNTVLGSSGLSSRLMQSLRNGEGLTYGVGSGFALRRHPGPFVVSTFTRVPETRRALDLLLAEVERARAQPPAGEELASARTFTVGRFSMGLETSASVLDGLVDLDIYGLPEDGLDTFRGRVRAITEEQVARAAQDYLHPDRAAIVLVGPAETLRPLVEDLAPVEVVEP
jgi:zinc protease